MEAASWSPAASEIGPERIVGRDRCVVRLGHAGDQAALRDTSGVAEVGLEDRRRTFLQDIAGIPIW